LRHRVSCCHILEIRNVIIVFLQLFSMLSKNIILIKAFPYNNKALTFHIIFCMTSSSWLNYIVLKKLQRFQIPFEVQYDPEKRRIILAPALLRVRNVSPFLWVILYELQNVVLKMAALV